LNISIDRSLAIFSPAVRKRAVCLTAAGRLIAICHVLPAGQIPVAPSGACHRLPRKRSVQFYAQRCVKSRLIDFSG
jgi:hypothetical protein